MVQAESGYKICVNTAVGMTDTVSVGDCVGQGSAGASLISQANIGFGLQKHFGEIEEVVHYGDIRIQVNIKKGIQSIFFMVKNKS